MCAFPRAIGAITHLSLAESLRVVLWVLGCCGDRRYFVIYVAKKLPLRKIYVDEGKEADRKQVEKYKADNMHECLIAPKDTFYFEKRVRGHESAFLRFWVLGAMAFYRNGKIDIPDSLNEHQRVEFVDKDVMVDDYVEDYLEVAPGAKTLVADITKDSRDKTGIGQMTFSDAKFFQALKKAIEEKGPAWESVTKRNGRVNGTKGMLYDNVSFKGRARRLQSFMADTVDRS